MSTPKQFATFLETHPEYAGWGNVYFESVAYEDEQMIVQYSFCVSRIRDIKKLIAIKRPEIIYYGTEELGDMCRTQLPVDLHPIIHAHGWYGNDCCVIVERQVSERWLKAKEAMEARDGKGQ